MCRVRDHLKRNAVSFRWVNTWRTTKNRDISNKFIKPRKSIIHEGSTIEMEFMRDLFAVHIKGICFGELRLSFTIILPFGNSVC